MASENGSGFFSGLLVGGAIGAIVGILFAPKAGKQFREDIISDSDEILAKAKSELEKLRKDLGDLKDKVSSTLSKTATKPSDTPEEREFEASMSSVDEEKSSKKTKKNTK